MERLNPAEEVNQETGKFYERMIETLKSLEEMKDLMGKLISHSLSDKELRIMIKSNKE